MTAPGLAGEQLPAPSASPPFAAPPLGGTGPARWPRDGFLQVRVQGTPEEMGAQHGELLRDEIRDLLDALYHHILYGQKGLFGLGLRVGARGAARLMETRVPGRYRREMGALAAAAGVPYRDILLLNCVDDVLANLYQLGALFGRLGCCAFAIMGERTPTGELLCGRNLDYFIPSAAGEDPWAATVYMREHLSAVEYQPAEGQSFLSVGWPGFIGAATAMNDLGTVVSSLTVSTRRNWPVATPAPFLYRDIMERAGSLDEALTILRRGARTQGNNLLLCSGADNSARIVEFTPWHLVAREPEDGWITSTNHFVDPSMAPLNAKAVLFSSGERSGRLGKLCAAGQADLEAASTFLLDTALRTADANPYCAVCNPCTIYSSVFAPARRTLWVRAADRPERGYEELRLGEEG